MRAALFLVVVALIVVAASAVTVEPLEESLARDVHAAWKRIHSKVYSSALEEEHRFQVFRANLHKIRQHNAEGHSWKMKMNHFGDLEVHEFKALHHGVHKRDARSEFTIGTHQSVKDAPSSVNWADKGAVTPIKNQAQCGSCWAFSTTGSLEGNRVTQKQLPLVSLSEQELVDCSGPEGNQGCNGGLMDQAFSYVMKKGLTSEALYHYTATDGRCKNPLPERVIQPGDVSGFVDVKPHSHEDLMNAVGTVGPISVAVNAGTSAWQFYSSGVMDDKTCDNSDDALDHGVLAIGYNSTGSQPYWIVKNSWGRGWGNDGDIWIAFGDGVNICGILDDPSYPKFK